MLLADYIAIRKIRSDKKRAEEVRKLKEEIKKLKEKIKCYKELQKIHRIAYLACGLSLSSISLFRGGDNFINVDYLECGIEKGLRYVDNDPIRKIVHDLFRYKRRGKIIYITATAACHLVKVYEKHFLALPIAVGDFGLTNLYQTLQKIVVVFLVGTVGPLFVVGSTAAITTATMLGILGLRLAFIDLDYLPTSPIDETIPARRIEPRIADMPDVVTVNFRHKVKAPGIVQERGECWLPEQTYFNPSCKIKPTEIPNAVDLASHGLEYDEVVNMKDVTGLKYVDFSHISDLGKTKPTISKRIKRKMVSFLEKYCDPAHIDESETWDVSSITATVPNKPNLRIRN